MWSLQVHALLDGHALAGYIDGSIIVPPETITLNDQTSANPDFTTWKRQDKLIYSALLGAISSKHPTFGLAYQNLFRDLDYACHDVCQTESRSRQADQTTTEELEKGEPHNQ